MTSSGGILHTSLAYHVVSEVATQFRRSTQIDLPTSEQLDSSVSICAIVKYPGVAPGSNSTRRSISLSGRRVSRSVDPKSDSFWMWYLQHKALSASPSEKIDVSAM